MAVAGRLGRLGFLLAVALVIATALSFGAGSTIPAKADALSYTINRVGAFGGEPSTWSHLDGTLYTTSFNTTYRSDNKGVNWTGPLPGRDGSGDDSINTDQSGAVYWTNLDGTNQVPLEADVWKSKDKGVSWTKGGSAVVGNNSSCGASCSPGGVDRQWAAASILNPATQTTDQAEVVLMYHDFWGLESAIWVNISTDGGATFGAPINVLAASTIPGAGNALIAQGYQFCTTVPSGVGIVPPGKPHAGRIIVAWIAADVSSGAEGCNLTQEEPFHTLWVSYSDTNGASWTAQQAYDAGVGHDTSGLFASFAMDNQGNPYLGFVAPPNVPQSAVTCSAEGQQGGAVLQADKNCGYDMYVVWSADQGATWRHGEPIGPTILPGAAGAAYKVNPTLETGTHWFPAIAANNPGQVDVGYLHTPTIQPWGPNGKVLAGGCAAPGAGHMYSAGPCQWKGHVAQSLDITVPPASATFTTLNINPTWVMHSGDICNLGIFCQGNLGSNRSLADFTSMTIDPTTGCAHWAYTDNGGSGSPNNGQLVEANQTGGCFTAAVVVPEVPMSPIPLMAAAAAALFVAQRAHRRRATRLA